MTAREELGGGGGGGFLLHPTVEWDIPRPRHGAALGASAMRPLAGVAQRSAGSLLCGEGPRGVGWQA